MENGNTKKYVPESAKSRIYAGKSKKRGFSKKNLARIEKLFLFQVPMNPSNAWKGKLEVVRFLPFKSIDRQCEALRQKFEKLQMSLPFSHSIMQLSKTKRSHVTDSCPAIFNSNFSNCFYFGEDYFIISSSRRVEEIKQFADFLPRPIWIISPTGSTYFCHLSNSQYYKVCKTPKLEPFGIFNFKLGIYISYEIWHLYFQ